MDRLIFQNIDFNHKPLTAEQRVASRKAAKKKNDPRPAYDYRAARRNKRSHGQRCNPSIGKGYLGPINLNRSQKWKRVDNYFDARDLSPSNRDIA